MCFKCLGWNTKIVKLFNPTSSIHLVSISGEWKKIRWNMWGTSWCKKLWTLSRVNSRKKPLIWMPYLLQVSKAYRSFFTRVTFLQKLSKNIRTTCSIFDLHIFDKIVSFFQFRKDANLKQNQLKSFLTKISF